MTERASHEGILVGIYGIQGVGKSFILKQIVADRIEWCCYDGSQLIEEVVSEEGYTMEHFEKHMSSSAKAGVRKAAIESAKTKTGITIVAGHCSFASKAGDDCGSIVFTDVFTPADGVAYDMIIYIEKSPDEVFKQVISDKERTRHNFSKEQLQLWADHEKETLETKCLEHDIIFRVSDGTNGYQDLISLIIEKVVEPATRKAKIKSEQALASVVATIPAADVYLLIDGDHTLCPQDTGTLFFDQLTPQVKVSQPLKNIFKRYDSYVFQAFYEVAGLYSKVSVAEYKALCEKIGREQVHVYDAWKEILGQLPSYVHPIIVSSSTREVWLAMKSKHTELRHASVIAGNHFSLHSYIVDSHAKALVVKELRRLHGGCSIVSFGDSAIDLPMLCESDFACIVVDRKMNRSMKDFIAQSAEAGAGHSRLSQIIDLDPQAKMNRCHVGLPVQSLGSILEKLKAGQINTTFDASSSMSAQIIATKMRDAKLQGPSLQRVHEEAGELLAHLLLDEFGKKMGLIEKVEFPHVQGGMSSGVGVCSAAPVLILPLMRGGEPMATGVYSCFPTASFIHFYDQEAEIEQRNSLLAKALEQLHSTETVTIFLVDSVINSGRSIKRAIKALHQMSEKVNPKLELVIFVLSGVMQEEAADNLPCQFMRVRFLTLRVSRNKYTGKGTSDTGNRLFGTTLVD